jgi:hypothetical protein
MMEVKNQFAKHTLFWVILLPFMAVILMPAFLNAQALKLPMSEADAIRELGQDPDAITRRTNEAFSALFVETGAMRTMDKLFRAKAKQGDPAGVKSAQRISDGYLTGMWHMLYRAMWRFNGLWPVLSVLLLAVVVPAVVDGLVIRATKLDQFKPHNPVYFWGATHTAISTAGLFLFLPFLPIPLSTALLYGVVGLVAAALWVTSSNLQTGN